MQTNWWGKKAFKWVFIYRQTQTFVVSSNNSPQLNRTCIKNAASDIRSRDNTIIKPARAFLQWQWNIRRYSRVSFDGRVSLAALINPDEIAINYETWMRICYLFLFNPALFFHSIRFSSQSNKKSQKFQRPVEYRTSRATRASAKTRILVLPQYDTECHLTVRVNPRRLLLHLRAAAMRMAGRRREQQRREVNMVPREIPKKGINGRPKARREKERRKDKREGSERKRGEGRRAQAEVDSSMFLLGVAFRNDKKEGII